MKNDITYNFNFTISKIMGIFIIIGGLVLGFTTKDISAVVALVTIGSGMITIKTLVENKKGK